MVNLLNHWFAQPLALGLLGLLPLMVLASLLARFLYRRRLAMLARAPALSALTLVRQGRRRLRAAILLVGLALLIVGIAGPRWGREPGLTAASGRDLVVVLDMSPSMQAKDVLPNRMRFALEALDGLANLVEKRGGHRLALVVFANQPRVACPLTSDYDHFRTVLQVLDEEGPPPGLWPAHATDPMPGTRIGAGLLQAIETHDLRFQGFQDILLISDGDDPSGDEEWRRGAMAAQEREIPVHTVGVGDPDVVQTIPIKDGKIETRLHEEPLEEIAQMTGGTWTPARTSSLPLGPLFFDRIEPGAEREFADDTVSVYRLRYPWFLVPALLLLATTFIINDGKVAHEPPGPMTNTAFRFVEKRA